MKISVTVPLVKDLLKAYDELQSGRKVSVEKLALYVPLSRFDARLFEILAQHLALYYQKINPFELNATLKNTDWSAALGAILNHSRLLLANKELFDPWFRICMHDLPKAQGELFFLGLFDFNPSRIGKIISRPSRLFREWGFFHDEIVLNKSEVLNRTAISKSQRILFLKKLLKNKKKMSAEDYRRALNYQVSLRQAQRDLKDSKL